jgi:hypothetical protein
LTQPNKAGGGHRRPDTTQFQNHLEDDARFVNKLEINTWKLVYSTLTGYSVMPTVTTSISGRTTT